MILGQLRMGARQTKNAPLPVIIVDFLIKIPIQEGKWFMKLLKQCVIQSQSAVTTYQPSLYHQNDSTWTLHQVGGDKVKYQKGNKTLHFTCIWSRAKNISAQETVICSDQESNFYTSVQDPTKLLFNKATAAEGTQSRGLKDCWHLWLLWWLKT